MADQLQPPPLTTDVSRPKDLINDANVSGDGVPSHVPNRAAQTYINTTTGQVYEWWAGAWH